MRLIPNTRLMFYKKNSAYVPGEGLVAAYEKIESIIIPPTEETEALKTSVFFCEWKNGFGQILMSARALGIAEMATIRMIYNPQIYNAVKESEVLCVLDADPIAVIGGLPNAKCKNLYQVWGAADDVKLENQFLEFNVRRYDSK